MKKVYLLLTAICLTALTGCIKEEPFKLEQVSLSVSLETRSGATTTQEQGDKIEDAMLWAFKCTIDANGMPVVSDSEIKATGWRYIASVSNTYKELENIHIPLDVCVQGDENTSIKQSYVLFAVINTKAFDPNFALGSKTTYKALTEAVFANGGAFWNKFPQSVYDENGKLVSATPEVMPVSNWATFTVETNKNNTNKNTHNGNCYSLTLPVYRAVAKTQLYMRKSSDDFTLTVLGAEVVSSKAPTTGAMFTKQDFATSTHTTKATDHTNATNYKVYTFGYPNQTDGLEWWKTPTFGTAEKVFSLKNSESATDSFSDLTVTTFAEDTYEWVASTFLLENDQNIVVNDNYSQVTTDGGGYYMAVTYQIDDQEDPYIGYVPMPYVVRNHDYHVNATVDAGGKMVLTLKVKQWTPVSEVHNYLNEVSIPDGGHIQWSDVEPDTNGVITLGAAANIHATCSFFLNTPANGTWQAELVTVEGQEGAITFADGSTKASGAIAGQESPAELTIKTTRDNSIQGGAVSENKVELRITATATVGGVKRTYKVTGLTGIEGVDYYTIVQTR